MNYPTRTITTPQRLRRNLGELQYFENDAEVGFQIEDVATALGAEGANYDLFVANANQHALHNVLCGVNDLHATADRYLVPATFFTAATHTDAAGAKTAFLAAFKGINTIAPGKGKYELIPVASKCEVELECVAGTFVAGDLVTCHYDATIGSVHPFKVEATANAALAIGRVAETTPILPRTGNVTRVNVIIDLANLPA